jgi:hypothetical protein
MAKNAWGSTKFPQKHGSISKKTNKNTKKHGGGEPSIGRPEYGRVLEKTVVSRVRMIS